MMRMSVLASGSGGNCTFLRVGPHTIMIDAGIGPRTSAKRLSGTSVKIADVSDLLLTHLDSDHFKTTWFNTILQQGIRVHIARRHIHHFYRIDEFMARQLQKQDQLRIFHEEPFPLGGANGGGCLVRTLFCPHDEAGSVTFRIESPQARLCYATDVGRVHDPLVQAMTDVDLIAIESNYDPQMQIESPRPQFLKARIMGGRGHLSNAEARDAVLQAVERSHRPPNHIVLLHLSRQCNDSEFIEREWIDHPHLATRLCLTDQFVRTDWLDATAASKPISGDSMTIW